MPSPLEQLDYIDAQMKAMIADRLELITAVQQARNTLLTALLARNDLALIVTVGQVVDELRATLNHIAMRVA